MAVAMAHVRVVAMVVVAVVTDSDFTLASNEVHITGCIVPSGRCAEENPKCGSI